MQQVNQCSTPGLSRVVGPRDSYSGDTQGERNTLEALFSQLSYPIPVALADADRNGTHSGLNPI